MEFDGTLEPGDLVKHTEWDIIGIVLKEDSHPAIWEWLVYFAEDVPMTYWCTEDELEVL